MPDSAHHPVDHGRALTGMIDRLLSGGMPFEAFAREFYDYYIETLPDEALTDQQRDFLFEVQQRLDWTTESPTEEERKFGWMDRSEYLDWLGEALREYRRDRAS